MQSVNIALQSLMLIVMAELFAGSVHKDFVARTGPSYFIPLVLLNILMLLANLLESILLSVDGIPNAFYNITECICHISFYAFLSIFVYYLVDFISGRTKISMIWAHVTVPVCAIFALGWCVSVFNGMFYVLNSDGLSYGSLYWFGQTGGYFVLLLIMFLVLRNIRAVGVKESIALLSFTIFPVIAAVIRVWIPLVSWMPIAFSLSIMLIQNFIQLGEVRRVQQLEEELENERLSVSKKDGGGAKKSDFLTVRTFGDFDVFCQNSPVVFKHRKTLELLAALVDANGAFCTTEKLVYTLWEGDESDTPQNRSYLRILVTDLCRTLEALSLEDVIVKRRGVLAVNKVKIHSDYFDFLDGKQEAHDAFNDEYMSQFSWAEPTLGALVRRKK